MTTETDRMIVTGPSILPDTSDEDALIIYTYILATRDAFIVALGRAEMELIRRMTERGATALPSETFVCELKTTDTYDQIGYGPLKEVFNETDLATCLDPAHTETVYVFDKWNTVKVKALARRYGADALRIVEQARIPGPRRLKFERRDKEQKHG